MTDLKLQEEIESNQRRVFLKSESLMIDKTSGIYSESFNKKKIEWSSFKAYATSFDICCD